MADNTNLSIDDILASFSTEKNEEAAPTKAWSMAEIDALLGVGSDDEESIADIADESESLPQEQALPTEPVSSERDTYEEEPVKEPHREETHGEEPRREETHSEKDYDDEPAEDAPIEDVSAENEPIEEQTAKEEPPRNEQPHKKHITVKRASDENAPTDSAPIPADSKTRVFSHLPHKAPTEEVHTEESSMIMELANETEEADIETAEDLTEFSRERPTAEKKALAGKTVGIYPIRNENIDHQILTERVEKSAGVGTMETDKYRERFLNRPRQKLERTGEYEMNHPDMGQEPIERPGMIIRKSKFTNTADLEPIPTIISADSELNNFDKTIVAKGESKTLLHEEDGTIDGQIKLSGFGEEEEIEQIDEDHAEEALKEKRYEKVASFKLETQFDDIPDDADTEEDFEEEKSSRSSAAEAFAADFVDDEYEKPEDAERIKLELLTAKRTAGICGIIQAVLMIAALVITGIISRAGGNLELVGGSALGCGIINILILLIACVCGVSTLIKGAGGIAKLKPNASTGTLLVVVACLLENITVAAFTDGAYTSVSLFTAAGCLALAASSLSRWIALTRAGGNFEFITNGTQLYSSEKIDNEDDAFEIGRGLLIGDPEICYNSKISMPQAFIENSFADDPGDEFAEKVVYAVTGAAVLAALIFGIIHKSGIVAMGMFAAVCCIAFPAFMLVSSNISLFISNRIFNKSGAAIVGHRAIQHSTDINAYALDSTDIFKSGSCSIIGIKTFHNMRIDDAILYAAALVIESGGPLADIFGNVILGKKELLPPVESLAYEERLGLSAWIHGRRVLFGSRELLVNHNVSAPERDFEMQYTHDGRKVMYLSIAGKIAAMFVIKYQADKHMKRYLQNLDKAGVPLLVRTCDCNISEEMICRYFNLPLSAVKILSPVSGDRFEKYRKAEKDTAEAGILHNGTIEASLKTIYEARELHSYSAVNNVISAIYMGLAIVLFIILSATSGPMGITGAQVVLFQVLWGVISVAVPIVHRRFDRDR